MTKLFMGVLVTGFALASAWALADDLYNQWNNDVTSLTAAQSAQLRAERDAAKTKWAAMTQSQKDAVIKSARSKKLADLDAMEIFGVNDDVTAMTKTETAQMKAEREAAKTKWVAMTAEQKAAARKAMQQKRVADLNAIERVGQNDDIGRYMSY